MLITNLPDVHYLCGFSGSNAGLLVWASGELLATDGRYVTQSRTGVAGVELLVTRRIIPALLEAAPVDAVGFDATAVTVAAVRSAQAEVPAVTLEPADVDVSGLRQIKDADEIAALEQACRISTDALSELDRTDPGRDERTGDRPASGTDHGTPWCSRPLLRQHRCHRPAQRDSASPAHTAPDRRRGSAQDRFRCFCMAGITRTAPARSSLPPIRNPGRSRSTPW